jgi:hypothetical protein
MFEKSTTIDPVGVQLGTNSIRKFTEKSGRWPANLPCNKAHVCKNSVTSDTHQP